MAHGLCCSAACGIFLDQGSNPHPLHWQADSFFFFFKGISLYLFISWLCWVFVSTRWVSLVAASRGYSSLCAGFSLWWLLLLRSMALGAQASVVAAHGLRSCGSQALECRLSSCGTWTSSLRSMWDLPRPGMEPVSPALAGGFLTTAPPGKSLKLIFEVFILLLALYHN